MIFRRTILVLVLLALLFALPLGRTVLYTVNEREQVVVLQFGDPVAVRTDPGLYFKVPFIQEVMRLPKTLQFWTGSDSEILVDLPTADGKKIEVTPWAVWRITDPARFVQVLRTVDNASLRVKTLVRSEVRDVVTTANLIDVVRNSDRKLTYSFQVESPELRKAAEKQQAQALPPPATLAPSEKVSLGREKLVERIKSRVRARVTEVVEGGQKGRGIELVDVGIARIEFVTVVREAAFDRLIAFMESIASLQVNEGQRRRQEILNRTEAEVQKILGEGSEEASRIRGKVEAEIIEAYAKAITESGDFYTFTRTLEAYESSLAGKTRMILSTDNPFLRLLQTPQAALTNSPR